MVLVMIIIHDEQKTRPRMTIQVTLRKQEKEEVQRAAKAALAAAQDSW